jgi:hypothetical protein
MDKRKRKQPNTGNQGGPWPTMKKKRDTGSKTASSRGLKNQSVMLIGIIYIVFISEL